MATSTLGNGTLVLAGTTSGTTTVTATAVAGTTTLTLPAATDTLVGKATTDTLTNKTLTGAVMNGTLGATTPSTVAATSISASTTLGVTGVSTLTGGAVIEGMTVGKGAGAVATNTAVGASALAANTSGAVNTAIGYQAALSNTTGAYNTAVGYQSLKTNTTGNDNSAFGFGALTANTTGGNNVAVGESALGSNTTASNNTAVGYQAGYSNVTGSSLTAVGYLAGKNNTGDGNVYVGAYTGYTSTVSGGYNTLIGSYAGYSLISGTANTFVGTATNSSGYGVGGLITTGAKNTIIGGYNGNQGGLDIRTASNYIVLSDGDGNPRAYVDDAGQFNVKNAGAGIVCLKGYATNASFTGIVVDAFADRNTTNSSFSAYRYYNAGAGAVKFIVQDSGNVQNTNNSYGATSDIKLKENIADASPKLEDLCKVKIRQYNLKSDPTHKQIGVIAQELEEVFAGMVEESADRDAEGNDLGTKTKAVKYSVFVPMLIKAIQELKAEVDSLKAQINGASA